VSTTPILGAVYVLGLLYGWATVSMSIQACTFVSGGGKIGAGVKDNYYNIKDVML
jgi:hypothetical protein